MTDLPTGTAMPPPLDAADASAVRAKPRWSLIAIAGFIFSFLLALAPLGIVLGIVGFFRTRGGRRRGMGLAVAAVPIGVVVSFLTVLIVLALVMVARMTEVRSAATACWRTTRSEVPQHASELYDRCSKRFQLAVDREAFLAWALSVADDHGSLQSTKPGKQPYTTNPDGTIVVHLTGQFVNGPADIAITMGWADLSPEIDDVAVDGVSPRSGADGDETDAR